MLSVSHTANDFLHLFFPHVCAGCGTDGLGKEAVICVECLAALPLTNFFHYEENQAEKIFSGRLPVKAAGSFLYFSKESLVQRLLHQLKYRGNRKLGTLLGTMMGRALQASPLFETVEVLVPLPLHPSKEKKRGYNQAMILCEGISAVTGVAVCTQAVAKLSRTETQTHKSRLERWQNIAGRFIVKYPGLLSNKHVLLVDDVITTGATLEACGHEILEVPGTSLSIATLAYTVK